MTMLRICAFASAAVLAASLGSAQQYVPPTGIGQVPPSATATPISQGIPLGATIPYVVSSNPPNNKKDASPTLPTVSITFDQAMDVATFYWPIDTSDQYFPYTVDNPYWTNGNKTVNLPVKLVPNHQYRIQLNVGNQWIFRSAKGVWLNPGQISFWTAAQATYGAPSGTIPGITPLPFSASTKTPLPNYTPGANPLAAGSGGYSVGGSPLTGAPTTQYGAMQQKVNAGMKSAAGVATPTPAMGLGGTYTKQQTVDSKAKQNLQNTRGRKPGSRGTPTPTPTPTAE